LSTQEIARRGFIMVLSSPSGAGKTTLTRALREAYPELTMSVSVTTRARRPNEIDGVHYHFITQDAFDRLVAENGLLEYATVFGNSYGTPRALIEAQLEKGNDIIGDVDWQGTQQLSQSSVAADLVRVFILPPSMDELERRLNARNQDSAEVVAKRMSKAIDEMSHWAEYDYVIVNRDVQASLDTLKSIVLAERTKRTRQVGLVQFVRGITAR
jgi:guanylate kinase